MGQNALVHLDVLYRLRLSEEAQMSSAGVRSSAAVADSVGEVSKQSRSKKPRTPSGPDWRDGYERSFRFSAYIFGAIFLLLGMADGAANLIEFADFKELAATGGTLVVAAGSGLGKAKSKKSEEEDDSEDRNS